MALISDNNRRQRDFRNRLRSLSKHWLSSDPIQIGDVNLPLRPVVGLLVVALGLVGIGAVQKDAPDTAKRNLAGAASVAMPVYPTSMGQYRSIPDELGAYRVDAGAGGSALWFEGATGRGSGYPPQSFARTLYRAFPGPDGNGDHSGYPYGGDRSFGYRSQGRGLGYREAGPALAVYQGLRSREEEVARDRMPAYRAEWDGYRFRPLNDQEWERMHATVAERPFVPDVGARSLYDELSGSYRGGFDERSAPARQDYSRTW